MPSIHTGLLSDGALSRGIGRIPCLPFKNKNLLSVITRAVNIIDTRIKGYAPCEAAFKALPNGKTFSEIWNQKDVWISYFPDSSGNHYGYMYMKNITISTYVLSMGHWMTASTIIHELAHVNGVRGENLDAENTLLSCLLHKHHDPRAIAYIRNAKFKNSARV